MKKGYALICGFLLMSAGVFAQTATLPLSEDFELESQASTTCSGTNSSGLTLASTIFTNDQTDQNEWRPDVNGTSSSATGPSTDHTPTGAGYYVYTETSGCNNQTVNLESVYMNWTTITGGYVQAWYHMYGTSQGTMHFDIRVGSGPWTLDFVPSWTDNQDLWQLKAIIISDTAYAGKDSVQIRFRATTGTSFGSDMALDDISIQQAPSCFPASALTSGNYTATSADLSWTENNSATTWEIEYGLAPLSQGSGTTAIVTSNPYTLTGLTSNTDYDWFVRSICTVGDTSAWSGPNGFRTPCTPFTAGYTTGFDGTVDPAVDPCWTVINATNSTGWVQTENIASDPQRSAPNSIEFYNAGATTGNLLLVSPMFSDLDSTMQIRFWLQNKALTAYTSDLTVGTMSDPNVDSTFEAWTTLPNASFASTAWTEFIVPFSGLSNGDKYIAFRIDLNGTFDYIWMDDFTYQVQPNCPQPIGTSLTTAALAPTSADLVWTEAGSATTWEVEYDTAGFTLGTGISTITTSNPLSISGLTANTNYDFYVRSICGVADTSAWAGAGTFFTGYCTPAPTSVDGQGITNISFGTVNNTTSTEAGNYGDYSNLVGDMIQGIPNALDITYSTGFTYTTLVYVDWNNDLDFDDTLETVYSGTSLATNPTTLNATVTVPSGQALGQYRMRVGGADVGPPTPCYAGSWGSFEDYTINVIAPPSCLFPFNLAENVSSDSVVVSWADPNAATMWQVEWDTAGYALGTAANSVIVMTDTFYSITGLSPVTNFDWAVRAICSVSDTSSWSVGSFTTPIQGPQGFTCTTGNPSIVFSDDFESLNGWTGNIGTGGTVNNWNYDANGTPSGGTGPLAAHSGTQYVFVETSGSPVGTNVNFISPAIDLSAGFNFAELSFWVHAIGAQIGTLNVGVGTSATGPFTTLWTYSGAIQAAQADPFVNAGVNLDAYVGQTIYVQYNYVTNGSFAGDIAIDLMEVSTCTSCSAPSNLMASNAGLSSADLGWTENGTATTWEVEYGTPGFTPGTGTKVVTTSNPYTVAALPPSTSYDYYVRAICGVADTSGVSPSGSFATLNGIPYSEDWENAPYSWSNTSAANPQWLYGGSTGSGGTGPSADHTTGTGTFAFLETSSPATVGTTDTLVSAAIITGAGDSLLELSFWYHMHGASMGDLQAWIVGTNNGPTLLTTISGQQQPVQTDPWLNSATAVLGYQNDTVRIVFVGVTGTSFTSDMAVDDISLDLLPADNIALTAVTAPNSGCGLSATESVTVTLENVGSAPQTGFTLAYELNGVAITPETYTGTLNPGASASYTFTATANMSAAGQYDVVAYTQLTGDVNNINDTASSSVNSVASASLPYAESFETGAANWFVTGVSTFALGAPNAFLINSASDGVNAWVTGLASLYNNNEEGALNSPCFDLTGATNPWISFDIYYDIESQWDGALMQVSTNGGSNWNTLGQLGDPNNWYNDTADVIVALGIDSTGQSWTGDGTGGIQGSNGWINAKYDMSGFIGQSSVRLRLVFASDVSAVGEGIAFDNVRVFDSIPQAPYYPIGVVNTVDANGVADSLGVVLRTSGTVVGIDLDGNNGLSFTIIDMSTSSQEGINIFNFNDVSGYVVNEGDSIMVWGDIDQFNGLQEVFVDSIAIISTGSAIPAPISVNSLGENTESRWISLSDDFVLLNGNGTGSYNMNATNGTDTITIRVDADTDVNDSLNITTNSVVAGDTICGMLGIGGQFDNTNPYTSGYQIFPMRYSDITICRFTTSIEETNAKVSALNIYPNPTNGMVTIQANNLTTSNARIMVRDISGRILFEDRLNDKSSFSKTIDFSDRANGVYFITIIDGDKTINEKLIKN